MSRIDVIQAENTNEFDRINGGTCIAYWRNNVPQSEDSFSYCRATHRYGTQSDILVGGHVIGIVDGMPHVFITPILDSVNKSDNPKIFEVDERDLVQVPSADEQVLLTDKDNQRLVEVLREKYLKQEYMQKLYSLSLNRYGTKHP